jgi:hypothetical protein
MTFHVWESIKPFLTFAGGVLALTGVLTTACIDYIEHRSLRSVADDTRPKQKLRIAAVVLSMVGGVIVLFGSNVESVERARLQGQIAKLSGETLTWITGGEDGFIGVWATSFAADKNRISFLVQNDGKYPAYDVAIKFRDMDVVHEYLRSHTKDNYIRFKGTFSAWLNESDAIGTIYWNRSIMYPDPIHLVVAGFDGKEVDRRNFCVQVYTRNGYEEMKVLAVRISKPNEWSFAYKVERKRLLGKNYPASEKHDLNFPLDADGKVGW